MKINKAIKNLFTGKSNNSLNTVGREYTGDDEEHPVAKQVKKISYAVSNIFSFRSQDFVRPEFSFEEIIKAYNTDGYVRQALDKYIELMFKAGWKFIHRDKRVKEYLKKRITMISDAMGKPFEQFQREIAEDLVKFHNVIILKNRARPEQQFNMPGVKLRRIGNKNPVMAYERLPVETMSVKVDENGNILKYKQSTNHGVQKYDPEDIIHIKYKQPAGKFFGVPFMIPVLDDVKLLRQVEDNVAKLLYRHLHPLFLYHVGKDEEGKEATDGEIESAYKKIVDMPVDGGLVLPERHDIDLLTKETGIEVGEYLDYFEKRAFTGMGVSETVMGRSATANKSTAENQAKEMRDKVKAFMNTQENYVNHFMIRELLLEGGFRPILNEDDKSEFRFNEIDTDLLIKEENHAVYKFEHDATTHSEMRRELGMDPLDDYSELRTSLFGPIEVSQADTDNRNDPQNQYNSKEAFTLEGKINLLFNGVEEKFSDYEEKLKKIAKNHYNYSDREVDMDYEQILDKTNELLSNKTKMYTQLYTVNTINEMLENNTSEDISFNSKEVKQYIEDKSNKLKELMDKRLDELFKNAEDELEDKDIENTLYIIEKDIRTFMQSNMIKAYNYAKFMLEDDKVKYKLNQDGDLKEAKDINFEKSPPVMVNIKS